MIKSSKMICGMAATVLVFGLLAGCGSAKTDTTATATTPDGSKATATASGGSSSEKLVVGFAQEGAESAWRTAETKSIQDTAAKDPTIELKFSDAQQKQENQIKAVRSFIAQKVNVIVIAPVVDTGWETVLNEAKSANIPVILVDRNIDQKNADLYNTFIGSDFITEGHNAAKLLADLVGKDKPLNIAELEGTVGASAATDRKKGFEDEIKNYAGFKVTVDQNGDFSRAKGKEVTEALLKTADGKKINAVFAHNDDMAMGAIQAIEEAGLKPGQDIKIVSIDGIKDAFQAIKDGKSNIVVECNPLLGPQVFQAAKDLKAGKQVEKWIKSQEDTYTGQKAIDALPTRLY
ncbi:MAG: transporter substrate-binding protein [Bacilli bacterium]|jgi:ABC-type sugar transport system substrate-binding protein|nr:transporter substrate-binding protein [Bacilli bacterium]